MHSVKRMPPRKYNEISGERNDITLNKYTAISVKTARVAQIQIED